MEIKETLVTDLSGIPPFLERIGNAVMEITGSQDEMFKVKLALEEALTNAMRHGNHLDLKRSVAVHITIAPRAITIDIHDQGEGFDYHRLPDPTVEPHVNRPCGRGVYLIRQLMDTTEYYDNGCGIRMKKSFPETR
jgi:serine/threonine-protein kinase RsbW